MDHYNIWCDLAPGVRDTTFTEKLAAYLGHLEKEGLIAGWRLTRRKLGFGPPALGEFHVVIEVKDLSQLESAFARVAGRREPIEGFHFGVNSLVKNAQFALYRDFPDPVRQKGEERF
jgi:hypothetical protein